MGNSKGESMTSYKEAREQCEEAGVVVVDEEGVEVCGCNHAVKCCGYSCPSKRYWRHNKDDIGKHKQAAITKSLSKHEEGEG